MNKRKYESIRKELLNKLDISINYLLKELSQKLPENKYVSYIDFFHNYSIKLFDNFTCEVGSSNEEKTVETFECYYNIYTEIYYRVFENSRIIEEMKYLNEDAQIRLKTACMLGLFSFLVVNYYTIKNQNAIALEPIIKDLLAKAPIYYYPIMIKILNENLKDFKEKSKDVQTN